MKCSIFVLCFLLAAVNSASALKCFQCTSTSRDCKQMEEVCESGQDTCKTQSIITLLGGNQELQNLKSCGICIENFSCNFGVLIDHKCSSCSSDLCNNQPFSEIPTHNGRECFGCFNVSSETCASNPSIVKCFGSQDRCIKGSIPQEQFGSLTTIKGCVSKNMCRSGIESDLLSLKGFTHNCCEGNLCNKGSTIPGSWISRSLLAVVVIGTLL
uniref:phospholipase A2 inhibitor gamma subunit B-like isoform X1 n=2 Tax=Pristiophorus japonicus TaxID=55135 RepID=UPI00398EAB2C